MGFVYLLMSTDSDGERELFKIGVTKSDIGKRIKSLSTGNPNRIQLINHYESKNYLRIEKWLHSQYSRYQTESKNEWFHLPEDAINSFTDNCKKADANISFLLKENYFYRN